MVMKDKLYKNNHKGLYYKMRRVSFSFVAVATVGFAFSILTYFNSISSTTTYADVGLKHLKGKQTVDDVRNEITNDLDFETIKHYHI